MADKCLVCVLAANLFFVFLYWLSFSIVMVVFPQIDDDTDFKKAQSQINTAGFFAVSFIYEDQVNILNWLAYSMLFLCCVARDPGCFIAMNMLVTMSLNIWLLVSSMHGWEALNDVIFQ